MSTQAFLRALGTVAHSPLALAAFALVVLFAALTMWRTRRFRVLARHLANVPETDRRHVLEAEMQVVLPKTITADQWLASKRTGYAFAGFVALLLFIVLVFAMAVFAVLSSTGRQSGAVVPAVNPTPVETLPPESDAAFSLSRDISIFDLRAWKEVPEAERNGRFSPVNYINYLHLRKKSDAPKYIAHYETSGYGIDLRCITHKAAVKQKLNEVGQTLLKEYAIEVDVTDVKVGEEFLIVIEGTYWNGFSDIAHESAATYTDEDIADLGELALIVLFPEGKPFKSHSLWESARGEKETPFSGAHQFYADQGGHFVYWNIIARKKNHHYKLNWAW